METLNQNRNFVNRELKIGDSKLYYKVSKLGTEDELDIPYENLTSDKISQKTSNNTVLAISLALYVLSIALLVADLRGSNVEAVAWIVWAVIATIVLVKYLRGRENLWKLKLTNNSYINIHKNVPSENATNLFIEKIYSKRNEYLRENYLIIDGNLNYENQLNNLKWLKTMNVISKSEFEEKYDELKRTYKPSQKSIGFEK